MCPNKEVRGTPEFNKLESHYFLMVMIYTKKHILYWGIVTSLTLEVPHIDDCILAITSLFAG